ncbi:epidermal patterning factor-like protein [Striga asiatica]|uniref:Epidermal patterning factor-like protein n=1 Tax=Striga asiatica TaxID=4170 RepID=A0A5A7QI44_STRAF|nr:epidermal patterning factor-like protein [Striga asiatica]
MRTMFCCFIIVLFLHILGLVGTSTPHFHPETIENQISRVMQITQSSSQGLHKRIELQLLEEKRANKEINKIGSGPPSCDRKCYGCSPCEPIQVPTTTAHVGVQYTNYEPEGWMCKCGPTFYSP